MKMWNGCFASACVAMGCLSMTAHATEPHGKMSYIEAVEVHTHFGVRTPYNSATYFQPYDGSVMNSVPPIAALVSGMLIEAPKFYREAKSVSGISLYSVTFVAQFPSQSGILLVSKDRIRNKQQDVSLFRWMYDLSVGMQSYLDTSNAEQIAGVNFRSFKSRYMQISDGSESVYIDPQRQTTILVFPHSKRAPIITIAKSASQLESDTLRACAQHFVS